MQRSKYKDQKYFKKYIDFLTKILNKKIKEVEAGIVIHPQENNMTSKKRNMYKDFIKLVELKYSAGYPIYSLKSDVINSIKYLTEGGWEQSSVLVAKNRTKGEVLLPEYHLSAYYKLVERLSLGIIFDIEAKYFEAIAKLIDNDGVKEYFLEYLLSQKIKRASIEKESYTQYMHLFKYISKLRQLIKTKDKAEKEKLLLGYIKRDWKMARRAMGIDFHEHELDYLVYTGYWCFESAAIVKIKGLDDTQLRKIEYYPKDLLDYDPEKEKEYLAQQQQQNTKDSWLNRLFGKG